MRKQQGWTVKDLAGKLGIQPAVLNNYECGFNAPPIERLISLAEIFGTTTDFLLVGNGATDGTPIQNRKLLERFQALQQLGVEQQDTAVKLIDALVVQHLAEAAVKKFSPKGAEDPAA